MTIYENRSFIEPEGVKTEHAVWRDELSGESPSTAEVYLKLGAIAIGLGLLAGLAFYLMGGR